MLNISGEATSTDWLIEQQIFEEKSQNLILKIYFKTFGIYSSLYKHLFKTHIGIYILLSCWMMYKLPPTRRNKSFLFNCSTIYVWIFSLSNRYRMSKNTTLKQSWHSTKLKGKCNIVNFWVLCRRFCTSILLPTKRWHKYLHYTCLQLKMGQLTWREQHRHSRRPKWRELQEQSVQSPNQA